MTLLINLVTCFSILVQFRDLVLAEGLLCALCVIKELFSNLNHVLKNFGDIKDNIGKVSRVPPPNVLTDTYGSRHP